MHYLENVGACFMYPSLMINRGKIIAYRLKQTRLIIHLLTRTICPDLGNSLPIVSVVSRSYTVRRLVTAVLSRSTLTIQPYHPITTD